MKASNPFKMGGECQQINKTNQPHKSTRVKGFCEHGQWRKG